MALTRLAQFVSDLRQWGMEKFGRFYGPYRAIVTSNADPEARGRILVNCPRARLQAGNNRWVIPAMMGAGDGNGMFFPPEEGDAVFIFFDNGDPSIPACYMGGWYAKDDLPDQLKPDPNVSPTRRGFCTFGGHKLIFDDTQDKGKITVSTPGGHFIQLDDTNGGETITIQHKSGKLFRITSGGKCQVGSKNGSYEPMIKGSTFKRIFDNHKHGHAWGTTLNPTEPLPQSALSDDSETS